MGWGGTPIICYYYFCVSCIEICIGICFHLYCTKVFIFRPLHSTSVFLLIMGNQLSQIDEQQHQHFIFVEITQKILFYKLDILYIFIISKVFLYDMCGFI